MKYLLRWLVILLACMFIAWPVPIFAQEAILKSPQRIVSLAPTHTEILFALGLGEKIVAVTDRCNYPEEAGKKSRVGSFANPDIDKIVALKPDLILAFGTIQKSEAEELEKRNQKVLWIYPHTVDQVLESFERIGRITGKELMAEQLRRRVEESIQRVQEKLGDIPEDRRPTIFRVMGLDPPRTIGGDSFQTDVYRLAGGKNVFGDVREDFFQIDIETLIKRDPDVIIVCGQDPEAIRKRITGQSGWEKLTAVKNGKIFVISCDLICRPGPRIAETIEKIADYLYPERFSHEAATESKNKGN
ncbi:MAG: ABC transporter substrate-binding protein [Thermodesulfobacteriota bacterium]